MTQEITTVQPWLEALDQASQRLGSFVESLTSEELSASSFDKDWTVAQVLSHLGSAAEISTTLVERAIAADSTPPQREDLLPIWDRWNAMTEVAQREAWYEADARHREALRSLVALGSDRVETIRIPYFAGPLTVTQYAGYRLSEHSVHGWDIAVSFDPTAVIAEPDLSLLWDRVDLIATRFRDAVTLARLSPRNIAVNLSDVGRTFRLELGGELHLIPAALGASSATSGEVSGSADAVLRLIYGRHRPEDRLEAVGEITIDDLSSLFPGF